MKELSIEEKAKRYDEAKERMKDFLKEWEKCGAVGEAMEKARNVFPELKESEDERIRKELIEFVKSRGGFKQEYITWLEKQGETSPVLSNSSNIGKDEQRPAEWTMDNIEELTEFEMAMMHIGGSFFGEHQGLDPNDTFVVKEQAKILLEMAPKQEWSAKDENFLNTTIAYLRDAYSKDKIDFKDTAKNCVNWLKSLKDRYTWEPSESDIIILEQVIDGTVNPINYQATLHAILEQLKKLRGE